MKVYPVNKLHLIAVNEPEFPIKNWIIRKSYISSFLNTLICIWKIITIIWRKNWFFEFYFWGVTNWQLWVIVHFSPSNFQGLLRTHPKLNFYKGFLRTTDCLKKIRKSSSIMRVATNWPSVYLLLLLLCYYMLVLVAWKCWFTLSSKSHVGLWTFKCILRI